MRSSGPSLSVETSRSFLTISLQPFKGPGVIGASSTMQLNEPCHWIKWRKNISLKSSKRPAATNTRPPMPLASTVKRCIVSSRKSMARLSQLNNRLFLIFERGVSSHRPALGWDRSHEGSQHHSSLDAHGFLSALQ